MTYNEKTNNGNEIQFFYRCMCAQLIQMSLESGYIQFASDITNRVSIKDSFQKPLLNMPMKYC